VEVLKERRRGGGGGGGWEEDETSGVDVLIFLQWANFEIHILSQQLGQRKQA